MAMRFFIISLYDVPSNSTKLFDGGSRPDRRHLAIRSIESVMDSCLFLCLKIREMSFVKQTWEFLRGFLFKVKSQTTEK